MVLLFSLPILTDSQIRVLSVASSEKVTKMGENTETPMATAAAAISPASDSKTKDVDIESQVVTLPLARVRTIMKSSPDVSNISQESLFLIAKSTELFIHHLTLKAIDRSPDKKNIEYRALADFVNGEDTMQFLQVYSSLIRLGKRLDLLVENAMPH